MNADPRPMRLSTEVTATSICLSPIRNFPCDSPIATALSSLMAPLYEPEAFILCVDNELSKSRRQCALLHLARTRAPALTRHPQGYAPALRSPTLTMLRGLRFVNAGRSARPDPRRGLALQGHRWNFCLFFNEALHR